MSSPQRYPVLVDRGVFVTMGDGVRLSLTTYRPDAPGDGPFPVVVESLPYRKDDDCYARDYRTYTYLAQRGIAGVRIDVRGTGSSTGVIEDEYLRQEQLDNLEVMGWLTAQPWCDGNLGMWGISWGGFSAMQAAMLRPPPLKAIAVVHATHDRFACDVHYTGGSLHAAEQLDWPGSMVTTNALPPDPEIFGADWFEEWKRRLDATPQWIFEWLRHQRRDAYWLHGSPVADYEAIEVPTLLVGGWLDGYVDGMAALAESLTCETRTVIGPWGHYRPATGVPSPTYDHFDLLARWFGHHLRGDDNGVMDLPPVTLFVREEPPYDAESVPGHWRAEAAWPPPDQRTLVFEMASLDHNSTRWSGPQWVGSHAPFWDRGGFRTTDPAEDDAASMHFETQAFTEPIEILGAPTVSVRVITDQEAGLVAARLLAVDPAGRAHLISRASRNLAFPDDLSMPSKPSPGVPIDLTFRLRVTSAVIPAGWRVRLSISGADFPIVWPPTRAFTLAVYPERSKLGLPVVPARDGQAVLDLPTTSELPHAPVEVTRTSSLWEVTSDGDYNVFRRVRGSTEAQLERGDLTYVTDQWWTVMVTDDDPSTTRAETVAKVSLARPGWAVTTEGSIAISGGVHFEVTVDLRAELDGEEVFRRRWSEQIPREWV